MIPVQGYQNQRVAVLGLGRSGLATAAALAAGGATPLCWDDDPKARAAAEAKGQQIHDLTRQNGLENVAALITSPGIAHLYPAPHPVIAGAVAAGIPVDNDIGLFFASLATPDWDIFATTPRVVAVTGSNGKSTTSALIHHILAANNRTAQLAGNIGHAALAIDPPGDGEVIVLELSSYQTELARALTPDVAVFTNISADHLDRHGGLGGYFAAKRRLFAEGGPDRAIIGVDEAEGRYLAAQLATGPEDDRLIRVSTTGKIAHGWSVTARKGFLSETRKARQMASIDLREMPGLPGAHNQQNACAAYAATRALGLAPKQIGTALATFAGLAHRSQYLGEKDGVRFVNDSKATNARSAAAALAAFTNIRWIVGGQGKDGGIGTLAPRLVNVSKAYIIGDAAKDFSAQLADAPHTICKTMEGAVKAAIAEAKSGDTVLLAPAAASFDQYVDFEARGEHFSDLVAAHLALK